jgi:ankyrin repeat protein
MKLISIISFCALLVCVPVVNVRSASLLYKHTSQDEQDGFTPLMRAAQKGQVNVIRALLRKGVTVDAKHPAGFTALFLAAQQGNVPIVKLLLNAGANPNVSVRTPHFGEINPLIWGILSGNQIMVLTLIKGGAEVDPRIDGATPLMLAVQSRSLQIVNTLLRAGANVNTRGVNDYTALMVAAENSGPEIARTLIAAGADVSLRNRFNETALFLARKQQHTDVVAVLKRAGAKE